MFSGKSEEMIRRLRRAEIAGQRVVILKPRIDDRYDATDVVSHAGARMRAVPIASADDVPERAEGFDVVGIDEVQFLGHAIVAHALELASSGMRVVVAGLDQDFRRLPVRPDAGAPVPRGVRRQAASGLSSLRRACDDDPAPRRRATGAVLGRDGRRRCGRAVRSTLS